MQAVKCSIVARVSAASAVCVAAKSCQPHQISGRMTGQRGAVMLQRTRVAPASAKPASIQQPHPTGQELKTHSQKPSGGSTSWSRITGLPNLRSDKPSHAPVKPANIFGQAAFFDVWAEEFAGTGKSRYQAVAVCGYCRSMSRGASAHEMVFTISTSTGRLPGRAFPERWYGAAVGSVPALEGSAGPPSERFFSP